MKKVVVLVRETGCTDNKATILIFDKCNEHESTVDKSYPIEYTEKDIALMVLGTTLPDYSMTVDHIGGRPNDRK